MAEKLNQHGENSGELSEAERAEHAAKHEQLRQKIEQSAEQGQEISAAEVDRIESKVEREAETSEEISRKLEEPSKDHDSQQAYPAQPVHITKAAFKQASAKLKPLDRRLSKIVQNEKLDTASNVIGGTVARPTGIFYGALFSFIASLVFLIFAKKYGYEYNAFVAILTFVGGYIFGLIVELLVKLVRLPKGR